MSPEERSAIQFVGRAFLDNLISLTTYNLLYGIYLALFVLSMSVILRRGVQGAPGRITLYTTLTSFLLLSLEMGCMLYVKIIQVKETIAEAALDSAQFTAVNKKSVSSVTITQLVPIFLSINSDIVVIWRAWMLFCGQRWIMLIPLALLLGTIGTSVAFFVLMMAASLNYDRWLIVMIEAKTLQFVASQLQAAIWVLSFAANTVTTLLVMYKLWVFNKLAHIPGRRRKVSRVHKVLSVLIESGLIYSLIQIVNVVMYFVIAYGSSSAAGDIDKGVISAFVVVTAMHPCLVVVLVHQGRSIIETFGVCSIDQNTPDARVEDAAKALEPVNHRCTASAPPNMQCQKIVDYPRPGWG